MHTRIGSAAAALSGAVACLALIALQCGNALAAPTFTTTAQLFGFASGEVRSGFDGATIDESLVTGSPDAYSFSGRARASGRTLNLGGGSASYALGAASEMDAKQVPFTSSFLSSATVTSSVELDDSLTFAAPLPVNAPITVRLTYFLDPLGCLGGCLIFPPPSPGVHPQTNQGDVRSWVYDYDFVNNRLLYSDEQSAIFPVHGASANTGGSFVHELVVQNGHTYSYALSLTTLVVGDRADAIAQGFDAAPGFFNVYGKADYSTTLVITGIAAFDNLGDPLAQFMVTNSDGLTLAAVPEPDVYWMLVIGMAAIGWAARRRAGTSRGAAL